MKENFETGYTFSTKIPEPKAKGFWGTSPSVTDKVPPPGVISKSKKVKEDIFSIFLQESGNLSACRKIDHDVTYLKVIFH